MREAVAILLVLLLGFHQALALAAQDPVVRPTVESLGVSFERIKRELRIQPASPSSAKTTLKLDYYVEVMGIAPEIQLFTPADLAPGPIPGGGAPTHREMIRELWTRPEFKAQTVPIGSLAIMGIMKLAQWQAGQIKQRKAEAERKKRDEELKARYPDLVVK